MKAIKAILFDFGGTLDDDGTDWFTRLHRIIAEQGCSIEREQFQMCADQAAGKIDQLDDTPTLTMAGTVRRLCEFTRTELAQVSDDGIVQWDPVAVAEEFMRESRSCLARNLDVLGELAGRFRLGCISNNWGNVAGWCRDAQFEKYFETMIDSTVVGVAKPDAQIFQAALDELKLPAQDCAYVGDKYEADVVGAAGAGLTPIWITGATEKEYPDSSIDHYRIETLGELLGIFGDSGK